MLGCIIVGADITDYRLFAHFWEGSFGFAYVDVKGGLNLKKYFKEKALAIFVKVPSMEILEQRLQKRGTESEESLSRRLFKAKFEMSFQDEFDIVLVNEDLNKSLAEAQRLYDEFKKK